MEGVVDQFARRQRKLKTLKTNSSSYIKHDFRTRHRRLADELHKVHDQPEKLSQIHQKLPLNRE